MIKEKDVMYISDITFVGYTQKELETIRRYVQRNDLCCVDPVFIQDIADMTGRDAGFMIHPGGKYTMIGM